MLYHFLAVFLIGSKLPAQTKQRKVIRTFHNKKKERKCDSPAWYYPERQQKTDTILHLPVPTQTLIHPQSPSLHSRTHSLPISAYNTSQ
jgi:hypothetical protein